MGKYFKRKNYYAVRRGRNTGIYTTWEECRKQVLGFSRCEFRGFDTSEEAQAYMRYDEGDVFSTTHTITQVHRRDVNGDWKCHIKCSNREGCLKQASRHCRHFLCRNHCLEHQSLTSRTCSMHKR